MYLGITLYFVIQPATGSIPPRLIVILNSARHLYLNEKTWQGQVGFDGGADGLGLGVQPRAPHFVHWLEMLRDVLDPNLSGNELGFARACRRQQGIDFGEDSWDKKV